MNAVNITRHHINANHNLLLKQRHILSRSIKRISHYQKTNLRQRFPSLARPIVFTATVGGTSLVCCSILEYERAQGLLSDQRSYFEKIRESTFHRRQGIRGTFNTWWNELQEGHKICIGILGINTCVFACWRFQNLQKFMVKWFTNSLNKTSTAPLLLSCFSHQTPGHLLMNMYVLWTVAPLMQSNLGTEQFLGFYVTSGTFASLVSLFYQRWQGVAVLSLGASGSVISMLVAACLEYPNIQLSMIFLPFLAFSAQTGLMALIAFDTAGLFLQWTMLDHAAHLGGTLFAFWYLKYGCNYSWKKRENIINWWHGLKR